MRANDAVAKLGAIAVGGDHAVAAAHSRTTPIQTKFCGNRGDCTKGVGRVHWDLVTVQFWSSSSTALLISLLERPSSRTRSGLSGRPLMSAAGRNGQG